MSLDYPDSPPRSHATGWLLVAAVITVSVVPMITRRGIFLDGMVYATIARNLAMGIGDPLHPVYTGAIDQFRDHPPLAFWLESLAFRALGDHWWVEKIYSLGVSLLTAGTIAIVWRWLTRADDRLRGFAWLPLLLWVLLPCWQWTAVNNLLENTLSVFAVSGVYCLLRAGASDRRWFVWTIAAALCVLSAIATKGPVGMFPLVTPLAGRLAYGAGARNTWRIQASLITLVALGFAGLLVDRDACEYFFAYVQQQVLASLAGSRETHPSIIGRAHILWEIVFTLSLSAAFVLAIRYWAARRGADARREPSLRQGAWLMLIVGLAASCPVAISPKQTNFYITPSYPFYVLALALGGVESLVALRRSLDPLTVARFFRRANYASVLLALGVVVYCWPARGTPRRDWQALAIVDQLATVVPDGTTIDVPADIAEQWALLGYLFREHYISLEPRAAHREFRLEWKDADRQPSREYREVAIDLPRYRLFRRQSAGQSINDAGLARNR